VLTGPGDIRDLQGVKLCAVGPATAEALTSYGLRVDLVPDEYRSEGVVRALRTSVKLGGVRVLLPRGDLARDLLPSQLAQAGAQVTTVTAYRTVGVDLDGGPDIYRMLLDRQIDAVTFTSGSSVKNFARALGVDQAADLLKQVKVACIGPVTAEIAERLGIRTTIMPATSTIPALIQAIVDDSQHGGAGKGQ